MTNNMENLYCRLCCFLSNQRILFAKQTVICVSSFIFLFATRTQLVDVCYIRMDILQMAINLDNILCRVLGISSPWSSFTACSPVYKTFVYILYTLSIFLFLLELLNPYYGVTRLNTLLIIWDTASKVIEIYFSCLLYTSRCV